MAKEVYMIAERTREFHNRMIEIVVESRQQFGWQLTRFAPMIEEYGGVQAAKRLLSKGPADGQYGDPFNAGRLDLIMEYWVIQERFRPLFTEDEIETASWIIEQVRLGTLR
jgi:hypothetical protein